jgi:F-type H+/Na+-transporting ATPase subunit alpha
MADFTIRAEDISDAISRMLEGFEPDVAAEQVGRVVETGDGIARITGLPGTLANELLDFGTDSDGNEVFGIAMNLDEHEIGAAVLASAARISEGQTVRRTGKVLSLPGR